MDRQDILKLQVLLENLTGEDMPQYGSVAPLVVSPMGTESLRSAYVEVPEDSGKHEDSDDESEETETPLEKIISNIKDIIADIEEKKKSRFSLETEGFLDSFVKAAQDPTQVVDTTKAYIDRISDKSLQIIGDKNKDNKVIYPSNNRDVTAVINGKLVKDVTGKITSTTPDRKKFTVTLTSPDNTFATKVNTGTGYEQIMDKAGKPVLDAGGNPTYKRVTNAQSGEEVTGKENPVIVLYKSKLSAANKNAYKDYSTKATFEIGMDATASDIKWAYYTSKTTDTTTPTSSPSTSPTSTPTPSTSPTSTPTPTSTRKPPAGTPFNYKGKDYVFSGMAWYDGNRPVPNPLQAEIANAYKNRIIPRRRS